MRFRKPLFVDVYIYDDNELDAVKADIEIDTQYDDPTESRAMFLVDMVWPNRDLKNTACMVVGSDSFIVRETANQLLDRLNDHYQKHGI
ncbi:hypothetical protein [Flagellimonas sp.]|uniref:hypothetical protein n=1 Tax=Flagellimonas sp. TaxID=2058762 RepID=UPI003F49C21D